MKYLLLLLLLIGCEAEKNSKTVTVYLWPEGFYLNGQWVSRLSCNLENDFLASEYRFEISEGEKEYSGSCNYLECNISNKSGEELTIIPESGKITITFNKNSNYELKVISEHMGYGELSINSSLSEGIFLVLKENVEK